MEVRDGFIVGIFNYCDCWCEACALTSRCRLFAENVARMEASLDRHFRPVTEAPPLPQDFRRRRRDGSDCQRDERDRAPASDERSARGRQPALLPEHAEIRARSMAYCLGVHHWLARPRGGASAKACPERAPRVEGGDSVAAISWFASLNASKIARALEGLAEDDGVRTLPPDHDGSAKSRRSASSAHEPRGGLVAGGVVSQSQAQPFVAELVWLGTELEKVFPLARAFVRPGFDEPDEASALVDG